MTDKLTHFPKGKGPTSTELDLLTERLMPIVSRQDGELIRHSAVAEACGFEYGTDQYYRVVNRWVRRMRSEHGIVIVCSVGSGYCAVADKSKTDAALTQHRIAAKRIHRSGQIVKATDRGNLNATEQKTYDMVAAQTADLLRRSRMLTRTATVELHGTPALPATKRGGDA